MKCFYTRTQEKVHQEIRWFGTKWSGKVYYLFRLHVPLSHYLNKVRQISNCYLIKYYLLNEQATNY